MAGIRLHKYDINLLCSYIAAGTVLVSLGILGVRIFSESGFVKVGVPEMAPALKALGGYDQNEFFGALLMAFCLPLSVVPFTLLTAKCYTSDSIPVFLRIVIHSKAAFVFVLLANAAGKQWKGETIMSFNLLDSMSILEYIESNPLDKLPHGYYPTLGIVSFLVCISYALLQAILAVSLIATYCLSQRYSARVDDLQTSLLDAVERDEEYTYSHMKRKTKGKICRKKLHKVLSLCTAILLPLVFITLSSLLPSTWLLMTKERIGKTASLGVETKAKKCRITEVISSLPPLEPAQTVICPELPDSYFRTKGVVLRGESEEEKQGQIVAKIYPDVLIFFVLIYTTTLVGVLTTYSPIISSVFNRPRKIPILFQMFSYVSLTHVVISVLFGGALSAYIVHWYHDHNWHSWWPRTLPFVHEPTRAEKIARTAGQTGNFLMGLLVLPAARNSIWIQIFNISWEKALRLHKFLAYSFLLSVIIHMVSFWVVYSEQEIFPHDILATNMYFPLNFHAKPGHCSTLSCLDPEYQVPGADNWTIPLMVYFMTFVGFPVFAILTHYTVRRNNFELFYYSHHMFLVLFFMMLWHASSSWYFVSLGIVLWIVDRIFRFYSSLLSVQVKKVSSFDKAAMTGIWFSRTSFLPEPGQYVFLNIPNISDLQWHPFSISGFDSSTNSFSIHAKVSGDFTRQLSLEAKGYEGQNAEKLKLRVDGPYGIPYNVSSYDNLFLFAGGIGITPLLFLLDVLCHENEAHDKLVLIWVAKQKNVVEPFKEKLYEINQKHNDKIEVRLHLTQEESFDCDANAQDDLTGVADIHLGRPNVSELFSHYFTPPDKERIDVAKSLVLTCGPYSFTSMIESHAYEYGVQCRQETFLL